MGETSKSSVGRQDTSKLVVIVEVERKSENTKIKLPVLLYTRRKTFLFERESILQVDHTSPCDAMRFIHLSLPTDFSPFCFFITQKRKRQLSVIIRNEHTARHIGAVR